MRKFCLRRRELYLLFLIKKYPQKSQNLEPAKIPFDTIYESSAKQILLEWYQRRISFTESKLQTSLHAFYRYSGEGNST